MLAARTTGTVTAATSATSLSAISREEKTMRLSLSRHQPSANACVLAVGIVLGISWMPRALAQQQLRSPEDVEVVQVRPAFYMIAGLGGNVAVQIGPAGVILVDSGSAQTANKVLATVRALSNRPIRYIINTSADADHVGGNETLSKVGRTILSGNMGNVGISEDVISNSGAASILAHENVLQRMSGARAQQGVFPSALWPTKVYTGK